MNSVANRWQDIKQRCYNPKNKHYKDYGGRGISMYEPWIKKSKPFVEYIGEPPSLLHSIDRIDNDGNYEPGNIRWANKREQVVNRRVQTNNTSGHRGVSWDKSRNKWIVIFYVNGRVKNLGRFDDIKDAIEARKQGELKWNV